MEGNNVQQGKKGWFGRENSIEAQGLETYLNAHADEHNGKGYTYFADFIGQNQNRTAIAKAFGVNFKTVDKWVKIYQKEQKGKGNVLTGQ